MFILGPSWAALAIIFYHFGWLLAPLRAHFRANWPLQMILARLGAIWVRPVCAIGLEATKKDLKFDSFLAPVSVSFFDTFSGPFLERPWNVFGRFWWEFWLNFRSMLKVFWGPLRKVKIQLSLKREHSFHYFSWPLFVSHFRTILAPCWEPGAPLFFWNELRHVPARPNESPHLPFWSHWCCCGVFILSSHRFRHPPKTRSGLQNDPRNIKNRSKSVTNRWCFAPIVGPG